MDSVVFDPLVPWVAIGAASAIAALVVALAVWRGLSGWWLRGLAGAVLVTALANPSLQREDREALTDIVVLLVDDSASQRISDRPAQVAAAQAALEREIAGIEGVDLRVVRFGDGDGGDVDGDGDGGRGGDDGTLMMTALSRAVAEEPRGRLAGAILLSDGRLHDVERAPELPAPLHLLLTGRAGDWDRRLVVARAPAFAIIDEPVTLTLRLEDQGAVPPGIGDDAELTIAIDGGEPMPFRVPVGRPMELPLTLPHGGMNVIQIATPVLDGELTDRNNAAVVQINGVRDRLRVLLVSGEPHPGERTWRNLLKSDSSVDLVHFTILRPPEKQDGVPVDELSLIAFPTRELFLDKIDEFDLIIFDRYKRRGILPPLYLDNVRQYAMDGGAVLIAAGPDFAGADSLYRSPLAEIMPGEPTGRVYDRGLLPRVTETGERHPVTEGLDGSEGADGMPSWGRWMRQIDVTPTAGQVVMEGADDRPLLLLDRVGEGRVALLASDQAWLWSRGYEGGGPQLELLRRLAHWMMKEPELEEEALTATAEGQRMTITRRTLAEDVGDVEVTAPDGTVTVVPLDEMSPGRHSAVFDGPDIGLYRLAEGEMEAVVALGPAAPREFEQTVASGDALAPIVAATNGGVLALEEGVPDIREVREGRPAAGRGWIGITPRGAYVTADVTLTPLAPAWLFLILAALLSVGAWLREGRR